jgi:hypothetical protein
MGLNPRCDRRGANPGVVGTYSIGIGIGSMSAIERWAVGPVGLSGCDLVMQTMFRAV